MIIGLACLALIVVAVLGFGVSIYNGLVRARNAYRNAFAQIDVQLVRRHDLIPNLVETAKGYLKHERETLEAVIAARTAAVNAQAAAAAAPATRPPCSSSAARRTCSPPPWAGCSPSPRRTRTSRPTRT
nr:LemA family protein [Micromonospora tarapacensis]